MRLKNIGLRVTLEHAKVKDIFFIPEVHYAEEKPMLADDDGWWYQVRSVIWCRACRKCRVRKEPEGFTCKEWNQKQLVTCTGCDGKKGVTRVSPKETNRVRNRVKHPHNPQARRPRSAQGKGGAVKDVTSESEDDEMGRVEWGACMYGVRMTPAHPWYVGPRARIALRLSPKSLLAAPRGTRRGMRKFPRSHRRPVSWRSSKNANVPLRVRRSTRSPGMEGTTSKMLAPGAALAEAAEAAGACGA